MLQTNFKPITCYDSLDVHSEAYTARSYHHFFEKRVVFATCSQN